jgi:hypothetical protein
LRAFSIFEGIIAMNTGAAHITYEDDEVVVVNGVTIQKFKQGRINSYKPEQIKAAGGVDAFAKLIKRPEVITITKGDFSESEQADLDATLAEEKRLKQLEIGL